MENPSSNNTAEPIEGEEPSKTVEDVEDPAADEDSREEDPILNNTAEPIEGEELSKATSGHCDRSLRRKRKEGEDKS